MDNTLLRNSTDRRYVTFSINNYNHAPSMHVDFVHPTAPPERWYISIYSACDGWLRSDQFVKAENDCNSLVGITLQYTSSSDIAALLMRYSNNNLKFNRDFNPNTKPMLTLTLWFSDGSTPPQPPHDSLLAHSPTIHLLTHQKLRFHGSSSWKDSRRGW